MDDRGVIGHARSDDLITWAVQPPLIRSAAAASDQLEVPQVEVVDGRPGVDLQLRDHALGARSLGCR